MALRAAEIAFALARATGARVRALFVSQTDGHARRIGIALGRFLKNSYGRVQRTMQKQLATPVEEIGFAGIEVRGEFVFVGGGDKFAIFFFHTR